MSSIIATCSICGYQEEYTLSKKEFHTLIQYGRLGRKMGYIQDLFPKIPSWIRSGAIDKYSNGFCICPNCSNC